MRFIVSLTFLKMLVMVISSSSSLLLAVYRGSISVSWGSHAHSTTRRLLPARNPETGLSKGFAFVTYYNKKDAEKALEKLNGHG